MTEQECRDILQMASVAIEAPAGYGKTEAIADMLLTADRKQLVLTHTNAGVDSLKKRFDIKKVPTSHYSLQTIAAFCMKWCHSFPHTAQIDATMTPQSNIDYYLLIYSGMRQIIATSWSKLIIRKTYSGIIVDEYQDCSVFQHDIIVDLSKLLPVRVLGDPLQGIFGWVDDTLIKWGSLPFPIIRPLVTPWRWQNSAPELGAWISKTRSALLPALDGKKVHVEFYDLPKEVQITRATGWLPCSCLGMSGITVLITNFPYRQKHLAKQSAGIFYYHEPIECKELFDFFSQIENATSIKRAAIIIEFTDTCFSNFRNIYSSHYNRILNGSLDFHRITKRKEIEPFVQKLADDASFSNSTLRDWFFWVEHTPGINLHRRELIYEVKRCAKLSEDNGKLSSTVAKDIRNLPEYQRNHQTRAKYICSRTVLSKGLEFDNVIVDMSTPLSAQDFYVAITRAKKKLIILSDKLELNLAPQIS
jgi:DNA helicase-2/ATP-dependent DNA helicase PcrA